MLKALHLLEALNLSHSFGLFYLLPKRMVAIVLVSLVYLHVVVAC